MTVKELRKARGMTQEGLAYKAGVSLRTVTNVEGGTRCPTRATLKALAEALEVRPDEVEVRGSEGR